METKLSSGLWSAYIKDPRHLFTPDSLNIFYNCVFGEDARTVQPYNESRNFGLSYLIDYWAALESESDGVILGY